MNVQDTNLSPPANVLACRIWLAACAVAAATSYAPTAGMAAESVIPVTPPGATDVDQAVLPPQPGLYIGAFTLPYSVNHNTYDSSGNKVPAAFAIHVNTQLAGLAFLYVYPIQPFGGVLGSTFVQPFQNQRTSIGSGPTSTNLGPSDAFSDVLFWSKYIGQFGAATGTLPMNYGLTVGAAFSLVVPDGLYNPSHIFNLSSQAWVPDPNIALTYNSGPLLPFGDNTQISTRLFYAFPQQDFSTGYTTGNIVDLDWSISEQFGSFRAGVAGYYQTQVTNDRLAGGGTPSGGGKFTDAAIGPVVEYFFPNGMFVKAKYSWTVLHENYIDQQFLLLSTGFKF